MALIAVRNYEDTPAARAAHLLAEPLLGQLGVSADAIDLSTAVWSLNGEQGAGVLSYLAALGVGRPADLERWIGHACGLTDHPDAPAGFARLPADVLDPGYRLPSSRGLPDSRPPRIWDHAPFPGDSPPAGAAHPTVARVAPPDAVFEYRDREGGLVLRVCRWDAGTVGTPRKLILPEIWARPAQSPNLAPRLVPAWPASGIPLFLAHEAERRHGDWIALVEGEKACLAARRRFPKLAAVCVAGGLLGRADWSAVAGRSVLIIPDQDRHGLQFAQRARAMAVAAGARVAQVVSLPPGAPDGWDVADPLPAGWTIETLEAALSAAAKGSSTAPDMSLMLAARRPPEPFPLEILPGSMRSTVVALAHAAGAPVDFTAMPVLALPASLVGGLIDCHVRAGWSERGCLLWGVAVGDPSSGKTPAASPFATAIAALEDRLAREFALRQARWQAESSATPRGAPRPPKPVMELVRVGNTTAPALAPLLASQRRGLTLFTDELSQWIENLFAGYRGKGATDRPFWLKAYDAAPEVYIRRTVRDGEPIRIPALAVGVAGYIQPDPLARAMAPGAGPADGLFDRALFCWPEPPPPSVPDPDAGGLDLEMAPAILARWVDRLFVLGQHLSARDARFEFRFTPEAAVMFDEWRVRFLTAARADKDVTPAEGKRPGQVVRLAVAHALGEWAAGPAPEPDPAITPDLVATAIAAVEGYFAAHRDRVDQDAAEPEADALARTLARWVVRDRVRTIEVASLRRHVRLPGLRTPEAILVGLHGLQEAGWIPPTVLLPNPKDWRATMPTSVPVAPAVLAAIARVT